MDLNNQSSNWVEVDTQTLQEDDEYVDEYGQTTKYDDKGNLVDPKSNVVISPNPFNMRGVQSEGDEVDEYLRNYVDTKHSMGLYPKVSSIAGCRFCKDHNVTCAEIVERFKDMCNDGWNYYAKSGGQTGARSYMRVYPSQDLVIVLMANTRGGGLGTLTRDLSRKILK